MRNSEYDDNNSKLKKIDYKKYASDFWRKFHKVQQAFIIGNNKSNESHRN